MSSQEIASNWQAAQHQLLVWPSSTSATEGFVLGWYWQEASDPKWSAATMVVAGVMGHPQNNGLDTNTAVNRQDIIIAKEWDALQRQLATFQKDKLYCTCQNPRGLDAKQMEGLKVVGYCVSVSSGLPNAETKKWLQKMQLSCFEILNDNMNPYPKLQRKNAVVDYQVILYNPEKVYRHNFSSPGSVFATILAQTSVARPLMERFLSKHSSGTKENRSAKVNRNTRSDEKDDLPEAGSKEVGYVAIFLERHSMLACHFRPSAAPWSSSVRLFSTIFGNYTNAQSQDDPTICLNCHQARLDSKVPPEDRTNQRLGDAADVTAGFLLGLLLILGGDFFCQLFFSYFVEQAFLPEWLKWLESFPIGFKLNVAVTLAIGQEIRSLVLLRHTILTYSGELVAHVWSNLPFDSVLVQMGLLLGCTVLGGSGCLALAMDIVRLLTMHLALLNEGFRKVYRTEFYLLATSWRLFRGKKQNILRKRTDTMEYDSMQLLMGSMLFVATLFLLTTVLVYYAFFTLLNLVVRTGTMAVLWSIYAILQDFPFGACYLRLRYPGAYTSRVVILEEMATTSAISDISDDLKTITRLQAVPESLPSILQSVPTLTKRTRAFSSWLGSVFSNILSGNPSSQTSVEFLET